MRVPAETVGTSYPLGPDEGRRNRFGLVLGLLVLQRLGCESARAGDAGESTYLVRQCFFEIVEVDRVEAAPQERC